MIILDGTPFSLFHSAKGLKAFLRDSLVIIKYSIGESTTEGSTSTLSKIVGSNERPFCARLKNPEFFNREIRLISVSLQISKLTFTRIESTKYNDEFVASYSKGDTKNLNN